jgi:hypothetical protein
MGGGPCATDQPGANAACYPDHQKGQVWPILPVQKQDDQKNEQRHRVRGQVRLIVVEEGTEQNSQQSTFAPRPDPEGIQDAAHESVDVVQPKKDQDNRGADFYCIDKCSSL